jgi:RNA polymerase sigma-70 factor (ECF subfamily)
VRALAGGDVSALAALYDAHAPALLALATCILRDPAEAEDLVHDVFLEIWQRIWSYDESRGSVRAWLLVRLRSRAIDRLRGRHLWAELLAGLRAGGVDGGAMQQSGIAEREWDRRRARSGVAGLTPAQREVIELAFFDGLSFREIGERLAVPTGTVKSRMASAVAALRRHLQPEPAGRSTSTSEGDP